MQCINGDWKNIGFYGKTCHQNKHQNMRLLKNDEYCQIVPLHISYRKKLI